MEPPNPGFLALVTKLERSRRRTVRRRAERNLAVDGSTPDLGHVVFTSYRGAASGVYEWAGAKKQLQPVSVLPGESTQRGALEASLGQLNLNVRHAISDDGSLVFWTWVAKGEKHLYVRDTQSHETLQIDTPAGSGEGHIDPVYQTASADGSKVFFTDTQRLTADSRSIRNEAAASADLYVFELNAGTPLSGTLRDLTPEGTNGGAARLLGNSGGGGGVIGASEDGSYVYFVANGVLAPGATRGDCTTSPSPQPHTATCNLYVATSTAANGRRRSSSPPSPPKTARTGADRDPPAISPT